MTMTMTATTMTMKAFCVLCHLTHYMSVILYVTTYSVVRIVQLECFFIEITVLFAKKDNFLAEFSKHIDISSSGAYSKMIWHRSPEESNLAIRLCIQDELSFYIQHYLRPALVSILSDTSSRYFLWIAGNHIRYFTGGE